MSSISPKLVIIPNNSWYGFQNIGAKKVKLLNITNQNYSEKDILRQKLREIDYDWKKIIRLSKSCLTKKEKTNVKKVLDKEFLGMGPEVKKFEEELTKFFNRKAVCFNSVPQHFR